MAILLEQTHWQYILRWHTKKPHVCKGDCKEGVFRYYKGVSYGSQNFYLYVCVYFERSVPILGVRTSLFYLRLSTYKWMRIESSSKYQQSLKPYANEINLTSKEIYITLLLFLLSFLLNLEDLSTLLF